MASRSQSKPKPSRPVIGITLDAEQPGGYFVAAAAERR
jgi:hypothetical protein